MPPVPTALTKLMEFQTTSTQRTEGMDKEFPSHFHINLNFQKYSDVKSLCPGNYNVNCLASCFVQLISQLPSKKGITALMVQMRKLRIKEFKASWPESGGGRTRISTQISSTLSILLCPLLEFQLMKDKRYTLGEQRFKRVIPFLIFQQKQFPNLIPNQVQTIIVVLKNVSLAIKLVLGDGLS